MRSSGVYATSVILWVVGASSLACSTNGTDTANSHDAITPTPNSFPDAPPNAPPPPAACGDMNGGGDQHVDFAKLMKTKIAEKPEAIARQTAMLEERYDLSDSPSASIKMTRGKPVQQGVRARLPSGLSWQVLASMTPEQIRDEDLFPAGFFPLPHPKQPEGGMLFPQFHIDETLRQTGRDLTRFDLDFDIPDAFLPEFPPPMFLTTRQDLGDVSQGQLVTTDNYYDLFKCILNPKQLDGLRLLLTPFPQ
jgi:cytochrome c peroxidase